MKKLFEIIFSTRMCILGFCLFAAITSLILKGLYWGRDIEGGRQIKLSAVDPVEQTQFELNMEANKIIRKRLDFLGMADAKTNVRNYGIGCYYLEVSIPVNIPEGQVTNLTEMQGQLEAKIKDTVIFTEVVRVFTDPEKSGIGRRDDGIFEWHFAVEISPEAAERFKRVTLDLKPIQVGRETYLEEPLVLYIDKKNVSSLLISADMRGKAITIPRVTGGANTYEEAKNEMERMQAILDSGKLPMRIQIMENKQTTPRLGAAFKLNILFAGTFAILGVGAVVLLRYRNLKIMFAIIFTTLCEIILILGFASLIKWQLDLAALAGIIAVIGTGVDSQIIMTDLILVRKTKETEEEETMPTLVSRIKTAFLVIMAAALTTVLAMGTIIIHQELVDLRGFAITTAVGVLIGYFITRPAYVHIIETLA